MHTVSRKSERLVNLTIALLATKRYLTKSEILKSIEGYEGSPETKERMFERDKDDLRGLGIEIEVGSFDPLFEDEPGYRIDPQSYRFQLKDLDSNDIAILSLAAQAWRGAALETSALSALMKLSSIGIAADLSELPSIAPQVTNSVDEIELITNALASRTPISFSYRNADLSISNRRIHPYSTGSAHGFWYLAGLDLDKQEVRIFRLDRIVGNAQINGEQGSYLVPDDFDLATLMGAQAKKNKALIRVRRDKAHSMRGASTIVESDAEWDLVEYIYANEDQLISEALWYRGDLKIVEPHVLRDRVISVVREIGAHHA